jgi:hypothetical protein
MLAVADNLGKLQKAFLLMMCTTVPGEASRF